MKCTIRDLALFGGEPAFHEPLYVGRPNIGNRAHLIQRINDIFDRKWLTNDGLYALEFEQKIASMLGVKHCIAICNATVALEIAIKALELEGEVLVPSFTFIATVHVLQWHNITPVFCDIDRRTHNIDPCQIERLITPRTTGILGVHVWGRPCDIEAIADIGQRYNLKIFFDAAHAFGCSYKGQMIGNFGEAEVFSFHATKFLNSFEGGAIVTNNDELAQKIRLMKNFGFAAEDTVIQIGTNGKMHEASAAMGLTSLENMEEFIAVNYRNYKHYQQQIEDIPGVGLVRYNESEKNNFQYVVLEIDENITHISRDFLQKILVEEHVLARRYFYPGCHHMEPYRSHSFQKNLFLPNTEFLVEQVLSLPTGTSIGEDEINQVCQIIRLAVANGQEVRDCWQILH